MIRLTERIKNDLSMTGRADTKAYRYVTRDRGIEEIWRIEINKMDTPDACGWDNWSYVCAAAATTDNAIDTITKCTITIEPTTRLNAPKSWDNPDKMIAAYPIRFSIAGFSGGVCRDVAELEKAIVSVTSNYDKFSFSPDFVLGETGKWDLSLVKSIPVKTFYSVTFRALGADSAETAWFDNKNDANEFYNSQSHVDFPVAHRASGKEKIEQLTELCR